MSQQFTVLYDFTAEEEGEMSVRTGEVVAAVEDVPGAEDPPDGWIHVEVIGENERGFVPVDYLEAIAAAAPVKNMDESKSNKPFGGMSIFPKAEDIPAQEPKQSAASPAAATDVAPKQTKSVFPATNNAQPLTNPSSKTTGVVAAFKTTNNRPGSPPQRANSPPKPPPVAYTPPAAPVTPIHSPITAALGAGHNGASSFGASSLGASMSGGGGAGGMSKLKSAAKSVQSMVHVSSAVSAPRVPSLAAAVDREDFDELVRRNDEYFARLLSSQADTFSSLTDMVDALSKKLTESTQSSGDLVSKLSELDDLIDEEKKKWKQQHENEKNADVLGRSKELSQAAFESHHLDDR